MAIPNNYIDKIKNKDSGESRIISPAADKVRVDNENFEGTDLDEVLDEVANAIEEAGSGDGTVTGVKVGNTTYEPTEGVVDLSTPFGGKVDKENGKELIPSTDLAKLQNLPTATELGNTYATKTELGQKANSADVVKSVSVDTNGDGTVDINVDNDTYTINLNHTHENMAKLVKCTEATLPQTLADDTIYVQVDNLATPTEIEALHIFGLEFTGGGLPAGTPAITRPSGTSINLGENSGSGVSKTIEIKANSHITGDLTVGLAANSDLSFDTTNLPSGVTYNSGAGTLTIAQTTAMLGVNITIVYSGSGAAEIDGGLIITGGGATAKALKVVVETPAVELKAIQLTGTQWLQTDYKPNADTEFEMEVKFDANSHTGNGNIYIMSTYINTGDGKKFFMYHYPGSQGVGQLAFMNESSVNYNGTSQLLNPGGTNIQIDHAKITYTKGQNNGVFGFHYGTTDLTINTSLKTSEMETPMCIGYYPDLSAQNSGIYNFYNLTIYSLIITENGVEVRHYVPRIVNGVPGLLDISTNGSHEFISSEVQGADVIPIYNSNE